MSIPKKHAPAVYEAQAKVREVLKPYIGRCLDQLYSKSAMIETHLICSKEADAGEDRHAWRGTVAVHYMYPNMHDKVCHPQFYFDEYSVAKSVNVKPGEEIAKLFETVFPAIPKT